MKSLNCVQIKLVKVEKKKNKSCTCKVLFELTHIRKSIVFRYSCSSRNSMLKSKVQSQMSEYHAKADLEYICTLFPFDIYFENPRGKAYK